jgi:hypothetical protein
MNSLTSYIHRQEIHPGPIDNSSLLSETGDLLPNLILHIHFEVLGQELFALIHEQ